MPTKIKNNPGSFQVKQKSNRKKKIVIGVLLLFMLGTAGYYGLKEKNKTTVSGANTVASDAIPSWWLKEHFGASVCEQDICRPQSDPDKDKLTNEQEYYYHSDPLRQDTNSNGLTDGEDVANNYDPSKPGKMTFEEAASDDNILGESLIFGGEIKDILSEMTDPTKVLLPEVKDQEIIITKDDSEQALIDYLTRLNSVAEKYFNFDVGEVLKQAASNGDNDKITELKIRALKFYAELKTIPVPPAAAQLHKYYIALVGLIPKVIDMPGATSLAVDNSNQQEIWFDNAQAYLILLQKISLEKAKLKQ